MNSRRPATHPLLREPEVPRATEAGYLGSYVVWRPTEGAGRGPGEDVLFTHAEVGDFDVPFSVQHHVVQFQVPGVGCGQGEITAKPGALSSNPFPARARFPALKGLGPLTGR